MMPSAVKAIKLIEMVNSVILPEILMVLFSCSKICRMLGFRGRYSGHFLQQQHQAIQDQYPLDLAAASLSLYSCTYHTAGNSFSVIAYQKRAQLI